MNQKYFHVDHVELLGGKLLRGILCNRCNAGLGMFQHCPEILRSAVLYLMGAEEAEGER